MKISTDELLSRGVEAIYPSKEELKKVLDSGKKLRLYQGFDPTGKKLHIGHMVGLRKLRQWQELGHHVIFLIGTGTGQAGDPSGKTIATEKFLSEEELKKNARDYIAQTSKLLRFEGDNAVEIRYNSDWLNKLTLPEILTIIGHFSLQQLLERDLFQKRIKRGESINMRAFIYPILQGYDSVEMKVDLEVGGSDQTFNMLVGRDLVRFALNKEKFVLTTPLLEDSEGRKIGKSEGNVIALTDKPEDLFGKVMSLSDDVIAEGLEYLTDVPMDEIKEIEQKLKEGENPMSYKKRLAFEVVKQLNDVDEANKAQEAFERVVQKKEFPKEIPAVNLPESLKSGATVTDALMGLGVVNSRSEAKRLILQGGTVINSETIINPQTPFIPEDGMVIQVGKRKFVRVKTSS